MDGIKFYREPNSTNVFAAFVCNGTFESRGATMIEGMGAVFDHDNSPVCGTSASRGYLKRCRVVSETEARKLHPLLFARLDD